MYHVPFHPRANFSHGKVYPTHIGSSYMTENCLQHLYDKFNSISKFQNQSVKWASRFQMNEQGDSNEWGIISLF